MKQLLEFFTPKYSIVFNPRFSKSFCRWNDRVEQTIVLPNGKSKFDIESGVKIVSFNASFGALKAGLNLFVGSLSDELGKKVFSIGMIDWGPGKDKIFVDKYIINHKFFNSLIVFRD